MHGYYIELPRSQSERAPLDYQRRQTVKNAERFITPELKQFEDKVLGSRDRALARERELFDGLLDRLIAELAPLKRLAAALAFTDVLASLAERAVSLRYVRPELSDTPGMRIEGGRHPVVERVLEDPFVPNDLELTDSRRMLVITGPNMGGKPTYMARPRSSSCLPPSAASCPPRVRCSGHSTGSSRESAPRTTSRVAARPSWWK